MFSFIKNNLQKIYTSFTNKLASFLDRRSIDEETLKELEITLLAADTGVKTTHTIIEQLKDRFRSSTSSHQTVRSCLASILTELLEATTTPDISSKKIFVLVGINGSGKTTFASKLAHQMVQAGNKTLLVAADTFRAAATEQLGQWAQKTGAHIITGKEQQDPASVVYTGCATFKQEQYDALIIDTAGRLQTKINLMHELAKIKRVITAQLPDYDIVTLLTIDAMLGQNSFEQAKLFKEATQVNGIALTKVDGTGKGGIIFAIASQLNIPILYLSFGEHTNQIKLFNARSFVHELLDLEQ